MDILECTGFGAYAEQAWQLLCKADREFIPALSERESTTQTQLTGSSGCSVNSSAPHAYFTILQGQCNLLAVEHGALMGFLSYIPHMTVDLKSRQISADYISTIVVDPLSRNRGICRAFYQHLFQNRRLPLITRTWSSNLVHIHLLETLGFVLALRLADDRGPGIDTVYFIKED